MAQSLENQAIDIMAPEKFHRTLVVPASGNRGPLTVTYAIAGPEAGEDIPTILFCCGMLATRLLAQHFNWMAEKQGVRVLCIDRPGIGGSTNVPIEDRISTFLETVPALLAHLSIRHVSIASHSAGTLYALNLISQNPEILSPSNPSLTLFSPWVHQSHSSVSFLVVASRLPNGILDQWDKVLRFSIGSAGPVLAASSGAFSSLSSVFGSTTATAEEEERKCLEGYGMSSKLREATFKLFIKRAFGEGVKGVNDEAKLCLKSTKGTHWQACEDYAEYIRELGERWQRRVGDGCEPLKVHIVLPESDILVGNKGMKYFQDCWENERSGTGIEVACIRVNGADHESTIHPANDAVREMFERAKVNRP